MNLRTFQLILLVICGFAGVIAMFVFGGLLPAPGRDQGASLVTLEVWGTLPKIPVEATANQLRKEDKTRPIINYRQIAEADFHVVFLEALANGTGPDLIILPHPLLAAEIDRLQTLSFEQYPERNFLDTFVQGGEVYRTATGYFGLPLVTDPLVLYYNRDLLATAEIVAPPKTWTELLTQLPKLTIVQADKSLSRSAIPLGSFVNIANAKDILSLLLLQAGTPITAWDDLHGQFQSALKLGSNFSVLPTTSATTFFNQFADPTKSTYTWNNALPEAKNAFTGGTVAFYLGRASELQSLRDKNPYLNFDAALIPQRENSNRLTFGTIYGVSLVRATKQPIGAAQSLGFFTSADFVSSLAEELGLAPMRNDLVAKGHQDPYQTTFYRSALYVRGWIDPNPQASATVFRTLVENVATGRLAATDAVTKADKELTNLFK